MTFLSSAQYPKHGNGNLNTSTMGKIILYDNVSYTEDEWDETYEWWNDVLDKVASDISRVDKSYLLHMIDHWRSDPSYNCYGQPRAFVDILQEEIDYREEFENE